MNRVSLSAVILILLRQFVMHRNLVDNDWLAITSTLGEALVRCAVAGPSLFGTPGTAITISVIEVTKIHVNQIAAHYCPPEDPDGIEVP